MTLRRMTGGYPHAKQFKFLRKSVKRLRTILGAEMLEVQRELDADEAAVAADGALAVAGGCAHDLAARTPRSPSGCVRRCVGRSTVHLASS